MADQITDASITSMEEKFLNPKVQLTFEVYKISTSFSISVTMILVYSGLTDEYDVDYSKVAGYYLYSFALNSESQEPSGSLNFSKLDKAELRMRIRRDTHNNSHKNANPVNDVNTLKIKC